MNAGRSPRTPPCWLLAAMAIAIAIAVMPRAAFAQPVTTPPPSGLYEAWSPVRMAPVGPLAAPPAALPRWLSVVTDGPSCVITFEPERRVVWHVTFGAHGVTEKRVDVDGAPYARSVFDYDAAGHLARKTVDGPGVVAAPWVATFVTDPSGRVIVRSERLVQRNGSGSRNLPAAFLDARWQVAWATSGATVTRQYVAGVLVRTDAFDAAGRLRRTEFSGSPVVASNGPASAPRAIVLTYVRNAAGALVSVERELFGRRAV
ncbi:MAG: hypothetical protein WCJ30_18680, partial [Deltaproteobacteria bacterium]